jgi:hypothetical protein
MLNIYYGLLVTHGLLAMACAFSPSFKNPFSQSSDATHKLITRCSLATITSEYFRSRYAINIVQPNINNGICPSWIFTEIQNAFIRIGAGSQNRFSQWENMIDDIVTSNEFVDLFEQFDESRHFDSESFIAGSSIVLRRYQYAIDAVRINDYDESNEFFGQMTHTLQGTFNY